MNTVALVFTSGNHNVCTLAGNTSFTLPSGLSTTSKIGASLRITQPAGQAYTITWPSNVTWVGTAPVSPTAGKRLEVLFDTIDGGATYIGFSRFTNV